MVAMQTRIGSARMIQRPAIACCSAASRAVCAQRPAAAAIAQSVLPCSANRQRSAMALPHNMLAQNLTVLRCNTSHIIQNFYNITEHIRRCPAGSAH